MRTIDEILEEMNHVSALWVKATEDLNKEYTERMRFLREEKEKSDAKFFAEILELKSRGVKA